MHEDSDGDCDGNGDNDDDAITALKKELNESRKKKKDTYQNWRGFTDAEEGKTTLLDSEDKNDDGVVTLEPHLDRSQSPNLGITLTESVQCGTGRSSIKFNEK